MAPYEMRGTTRVIPIANGKSGKPIQTGKDYFVIQIKNAQAVFTGRIWEQAKQLVVTSMVALGSQEARAIHRTRSIQKNRAEQLGLNSNIVDLVPATMDRVVVGVEFLLDKENRLAALANLINDNALVSMLSLSPPQAAAAKAVGVVAQKIIDSFLDTQDRAPILQFVGDFNLATGGLQETYYAILGSTDGDRPLPEMPKLSVRDGELLSDGKLVTEWSYVLLEVTATEVRTKDLGRGSPWYQKLSQVQARAASVANNPFATDKERRRAWEEVQRSIEEANLLLSMDPLYLSSEVAAIIRQAYYDARQQIFGTAAMAAPALSRSTRSRLGIADESALEAESKKYFDSSTQTRQKLAGLGVLPSVQRSLDLAMIWEPTVKSLEAARIKPADKLLDSVIEVRVPSAKDMLTRRAILRDTGPEGSLTSIKDLAKGKRIFPGPGKFKGGGGFGGGSGGPGGGFGGL